MNRRNFLMSASCAAVAAAADRKPNIVLIVLDDLGSGDLGCYGQRHIRTPNIDRLAREGMRFTSAYAGATVCAPSRAVLMTGLHGGHAPVRANAGTIPILDADLTVAEVLRSAGYATGGFGKWGLGDARTPGMPAKQGFDEFFGYLHQVHAHSYYPEFLWDNERKYELPKGRYSADAISERTRDFIRRNQARPFFAYACWTLPHSRFEVPDVGPYAGQSWPEGHKTYAAMVTRADTHVGEVLALLRELDLERDTIVMVTSDNGAHSGKEKGFEFFRSNGDLRGEKGQVYEGGIRVPLIVRWPGKIRAGSTSGHLTAFCDMLPTLAEIAAARTPKGLDGISIVPELTGGKQTRHEYLYWEHNIYDAKGGRLRDERLQQAVRWGRWKMVRISPEAAIELYDLAADPGESRNVADSNREVVRKLEDWMRSARTPPRPHNTGSMKWVSD
jgi:arylsulfatase A-like enzyme